MVRAGQRVLVTGANGFVGRHLIPALVSGGFRVRAALRPAASPLLAPVETVRIGDLAAPVAWRDAVDGADGVVHLAGLAHARGLAPELYDAVNHRATAGLAQAAANAGVQRLVFVSSILAQSGPGTNATLTEAGPATPTGPYGASKLAAESALAAMPLESVILRPVLVYGHGVKGNMGQLAALARLPIPLPFGAVRNRRSLVAVEDLAAAIVLVLNTPQARGETYLVADDAPMSLPEMITALRAGLGRKPGLLALPPAWLAGVARLAGRGEQWARAGESLVASNRKLRGMGWSPKVDTRDGLARLAAGERVSVPRS